MEVILFIFKMLLVFQFKHFLCDYPLQNDYMLGKFKKDWGFFWPLAAHAGMHALFTFCIVMHYDREQYDVQTVAFALAIFDFVCHFFMDRIKAGEKYLGRFKALSAKEYVKSLKMDPNDIYWDRRSNKLFWWCLGFDQMFHHLTHYAIIFIMLVDKYGYVAR